MLDRINPGCIYQGCDKSPGWCSRILSQREVVHVRDGFIHYRDKGYMKFTSLMEFREWADFCLLHAKGCPAFEGNHLYRELRMTPTTNQQRFIDLDCREALFLGGTGFGKSTALVLSALKYAHFANYDSIIFTTSLEKIRPVLLECGLESYWQKSEVHYFDCCQFPSGARLRLAPLKSEHSVFQYGASEYQFIGFDDLSTFALHHDVNPYQFMLCRLRNHNDLLVPLRMRATDNLVGMSPLVKDRFLPDREVVRG